MQKYRLKFECIKEGTVYGQGGSECHGLFFALLRETRPDYSQALHESKSNPYSLGSLRGDGQRIKGIFHMNAGSEYSFTISSLSDKMGEAISSLQTFFHPAHQFRLGSADCRWLGLEKIAETHYQQLLSKNPSHRFTIDFISSTCFRSQGVSLLFPSPELVFANLLERWNTFAPVCLEVEPNDVLFVSRYNLKTSLVQFAKYKMTGFTGRVEYSFSNAASGITRQSIEALARFADFAGIGYKTGMGMGESRFSD